MSEEDVPIDEMSLEDTEVEPAVERNIEEKPVEPQQGLMARVS